MQKQPKLTKLRKDGGFTLIEMLIVVAIIAILVAISLPMINSSLEKARNATDAANVRAAKAAAILDFMSEDPEFFELANPTDTTIGPYKYDAVAGKFISGTPTGYGKSAAANVGKTGATLKSGTTEVKDAHLEVLLNADGTVNKVEWVKP